MITDKIIKQIAKEVLQLLRQMRLKPVGFRKGNAIGFRFPLENVLGNSDDDNEYGYVLISPDSFSILHDYYLEELAENKFLDVSHELVTFMKKKYGISLPMPNRSHGLGSGVIGYLYLYTDNHIRASVDKLTARYVTEKKAALGVKDVLFRMYKKAFTNAVQVLYKQFYRSQGWDTFEGLSTNLQPGLWEVTSKYGGAIVAVSYHVSNDKILLTCGLQNPRHRMEELNQVTPLEYFFSRDMGEKDIQEYIEKYISECAKKVWKRQ